MRNSYSFHSFLIASLQSVGLLGLGFGLLLFLIQPAGFVKSATTSRLNSGRSVDYNWLIWTQPYLTAILVVLIAVILWCKKGGLGGIETALLVIPISLTAAALFPLLLDWSWSLLGLGLLLSTLVFNRFQLTTPKNWFSSAFGRFSHSQSYLLPLLVAGFTLCFFMAMAPSFSYDTRLFLSWTAKIHTYGPFNIYQHVPDLDYLPLLVYILWVYGWLLTPFGLATNLLVFKLVMSVLGLAIVAGLYLMRRRPAITNQVEAFALPKQTNQMLILATFSVALLFNPAVWGQVDSLLGLLLIIAFWLLYRNKLLLAGLELGMLLIFKPQAWFVLPLLGILLLKRGGWHKGMVAIGLGLLTGSGLTGLAFGGQVSEFLKFWFQPSLAGTGGGGTAGAFNFFWLLNLQSKPASSEVMWLGFGLITLVYLLVVAHTIWGEARIEQVACGATLIMLAFFLFSIKMHERYLYYSLPLLALTGLYNRRAFKPYLLLNFCCLVNMLHGYILANKIVVSNTEGWKIISEPTLVCWLTLGVMLYLLWFYIVPLHKTRKQLPVA